MLGLLLMAGMGFAATAIMDHIDNQTTDDSHAPEEDETAPHGSLLDDPDTHDIQTAHAESATHSDPAPDHHATHHHEAAHGHHQMAQHQTSHHTAHHTAQHSAHHSAHHHPAHHTAAHHPATHVLPSHGQHAATTGKVFGTEGNDTLHGSAKADLMEGNGGDDKLYGHGGNDNLVGFDAGHDTLNGGAGNDSLHGYLLQKEPGDVSYVIEDHQADHLHGGLGKDSLFLGSDDVGSGGQGADSFHVSWDVAHGHPAQITDYNPKQDKIYVEFTSNHADDGMTDARPEEQTITTEPMKDGAGTSILMNGQAIAHVLGALHLTAADIGLIHA